MTVPCYMNCVLTRTCLSQVDMLLLAGDLFHENRPSRTALYQTMAALREHTMGPRPVSLEILSEAGAPLIVPSFLQLAINQL